MLINFEYFALTVPSQVYGFTVIKPNHWFYCSKPNLWFYCSKPNLWFNCSKEELGGSVVDCPTWDWGVAGALSKTLYPLLDTGSTREDQSWHDWNTVDWDVKNHKQANKLFPSFYCFKAKALVLLFQPKSFVFRPLIQKLVFRIINFKGPDLPCLSRCFVRYQIFKILEH